MRMNLKGEMFGAAGFKQFLFLLYNKYQFALCTKRSFSMGGILLYFKFQIRIEFAFCSTLRPFIIQNWV